MRRTVAIAALLTGLLPAQEAIKRGPWRARHVPEGWVMHESQNYQVQSQAGPEKAERLAEHMESMLALYKQLFRADKPFNKRYTIKLFKDREAFQRYGGKDGVGAYYSATDREMVCYDTGKWMDAATGPVTAKRDGDGDSEIKEPSAYRELLERYKMDILGAAAHEGWHQYFHWYVVSWVELSPWVNEGMGDYFYCARPMHAAGKQLPAQLGRLNGMRMPTIWTMLEKGEYVPLAEFILYSKEQYYANPGPCYAQGWALCHFLQHSGNKEYARVLPTFIKLAKSDGNMEEVNRKAFRGIDLQQLEADWKAWVLADGIEAFKAELRKGGPPIQLVPVREPRK